MPFFLTKFINFRYFFRTLQKNPILFSPKKKKIYFFIYKFMDFFDSIFAKKAFWYLLVQFRARPFFILFLIDPFFFIIFTKIAKKPYFIFSTKKYPHKIEKFEKKCKKKAKKRTFGVKKCKKETKKSDIFY